MKRLAFAMMAVSVLTVSASAREWTDATGQARIQAEYMGCVNGQVKLQFPNGVVREMGMGLLSEADQMFVQQQLAKAEAEVNGPPDRFTQAILDNPTDPDAYINRGMARTNKKEFDGAIKDFTKAIELDPQDPHAYNGRGLAHHKKNELIQAQEDFNKAIELDNELASAYRNRGQNLYKLALDPKQSVPELDQEIERWQQFWNHARKSNTSNTPWQPLHAIKGDVSRPAVMMQMAKKDIEFADRWERDHDWGHGWHGGDGHHGPGCDCEACSGNVCAHCGGRGCPACGGAAPAPGLGVYPPQCMKGETITLVANASQLTTGMPSEAKPGEKPGPNAPKVSVDSVDFYRDVDGNGLFQAETDAFLGADAQGSDGFSLEVSTSAFPPGPQSYFAVPRGAAGTGTGATPEDMLAAADTLEAAAQTQQGIAKACESGQAQGLSEDQSKGLSGDQQGIQGDTEGLADKVAGGCPEAADLLEEAAKPMKAVKNLMNTAQKRPGDACKGDAEKAADKAQEAADKLAQAAQKLRDAAEAAKASGAANEGQAPANAACGMPTSGANEILAAAPIGTRGVGGGDGGDGDDGDDGLDDDDEEWVEEIVTEEVIDDLDEDELVETVEEYVDDCDYDSAVIAYDELLRRDPDNIAYLRDRANTNLLRGGYNYAIQDYDRLVELREEPDADLYYNRGCAHLAAGRLDQALSDFTKSISLNETYSLAYNNRGATYARMNQFDKAITDFTAAIEIEPANRLAYRNRALAYKKLGELRKAQADAEMVAKLQQEGSGAAED